MKVVKVALPLVILGVAACALAQDADSRSSNGRASPGAVIVSWRHFSNGPASDPPDPPPSVAANRAQGTVPDPPASAATDSAPSASQPQIFESSGPASDPQDPPSAATGQALGAAGSHPPDSTTTDSAPSASQPQILEQDIRHKPGPLEPVRIPLADQSAVPLTGQPQQTSSPPAAQAHTPESEVAALTTGFEQREANREAQRKELESAAAKDPASQALARIQETQLLLEGEQDRMQSAQQLSKEFADLAEEISQRAAQIQSLAGTHQLAAAQAQAELRQLDRKTPRLDLTLHNMAMLPPGAQNDGLMRDLDAQLAQADSTRARDQEVAAQDGQETQALAADVARLNGAAAQARRKSAEFSQAATDAKINQGRLADRLEYDVTRQRASDLLGTFGKTIHSSVALTANIAIAKDVSGGAGPAAPAANAPVNGVNILRDCIRDTGNVGACRAKEGQ